MDIKLIFPPFWSVTQPYLSLPCLAAYLEQKGVKTKQIDLNLEFYDYILSEKFMKKYESYEFSDETRNIYDIIVKEIDLAKERFRSSGELNKDEYEENFAIMISALNLLSVAIKPENITFGYYDGEVNIKNVNDLEQFIHSINQFESNTFLYQVLNILINKFDVSGKIIGISITDLQQIVPSIIIATLIKKKNPIAKIVFGGNIPSRWIDQLENLKPLFKIIDYISLNEGEESLYLLTKYVHGQATIEEVPSLVYLENNQIVKTNKASNIDINKLPTPLFSKNDLPRYFMPKKVLPLLTSRGCYWGKCTFCDHSFIYQGLYRKRSIDNIMKDIETYNREYGSSYINFHDEAISPIEIEKISEELLRRNIEIKWSCDARLDKGLTEKRLERAKMAGLSVLYFGLESINSNVIKNMCKGTDPAILKEILTYSTKLGVWNHLFYICNFPGETTDEFSETLNFLCDNKKIIQSDGCAKFSLNKFSPIAFHHEEYGLSLEKNTDIFELSYTYKERLFNSKEKELKDVLYHRAIEEEKYGGTYGKLIGNLQRDHWVIFNQTMNQLNLNKVEYILSPGIIVKNNKLYNLLKLEVLELGKDSILIINLLLKKSSYEEILQYFMLNKEIERIKMVEILNKFIIKLKEQGILRYARIIE